jgi:phytoene synthase
MSQSLVLDSSAAGAERVVDPAVAIRECREMITKGSKSFSLAARIFDPRTRDSAFLLYGWCRYCDDVVDSHSHESREALEKRVDALRTETARAFTAAAERSSFTGSHTVFTALSIVAGRHGLKPGPALDLIEGMAMDARREQPDDEAGLELYCYRVAGTVGLLMAGIMGAGDERAPLHAQALGSAMQMTNIARDIRDDFEMGRVYLPESWLRQAGVKREDILRPENREKLVSLVQRLLALAEVRYREGEAGLRYLPWRSGLAVAAASAVYREIGRQVARRGASAWDSRTVVSLSRKLAVMAGSSVRFFLKKLGGRL